MAEAASAVVPGNDTGGGGNWSDSLDADMKPWVAGMGIDKLPPDQALAKVLPMYRGAEQKLGVPADQVLRLPGKDAKPEDWKPVWARLGAPEKPEGYELKAPDGDPGEFVKTAATWFHELGVPKAMAAGLAQRWDAYNASSMAKADTDWNTRFESEITALKDEWKGDDFAKNTDLAKRVMKNAGWSDQQLQAMERALGPKAMLAGFAKFGAMVGEHRFVGGQGAGSQFGMTAEQAKQRISDVQKDQAWAAAYMAGDADKKAEMKRLHEIAYGTEPANQQAVTV